jgi:hypothetical protein
MIENKGYLNGNARHWFWPAAGILALIMVYRVVLDILFRVLGLSGPPQSEGIYIVAGIHTFLYTASWITILLAYGLNNRVKVFKGFSIALACMQLLYAANHFFTSYWATIAMRYNYIVPPSYLRLISLIPYVLSLVWIVFMGFVIFHKRTGRVLRASAITVLAGELVVFIVHWFFYNSLMHAIYSASIMLSGYMITAASAVLLAVQYIPYIFFFGAMSFSRPKENPPLEEAA